MAVVGQFKLPTVFMRPKFHPPFLDWVSVCGSLVRKNGAGRRDRCLPAPWELSLVMKRGVPGPAWFLFWKPGLWKHQRLQDFLV